MAVGRGELSPDPDQLLAAERPGAQPQVLAGVPDIDPDLFLGRRIVSHSREPRRGPPAAAGGVDNQVGGKDFLAAAAAWGQDPGAGDPVAALVAAALAVLLDRTRAARRTHATTA